MRAPYDTTCDIVTGPTSPLPGVITANIPCRYVRELIEIPQSEPLVERLAYVTMEGAIPVGPEVSGGPDIYSSDYGASDLIAIPSGNDTYYQVLLVEYVSPHNGTAYYRAHVRLSETTLFLAQEDLQAILTEAMDDIVVT